MKLQLGLYNKHTSSYNTVIVDKLAGSGLQTDERAVV